MNNQNRQNRKNTQNSPIMSTSISSFISCFLCIFIFGMLLSVIRYSMAASAMVQGDVRSAAAMMNPGYTHHRPAYDPYYRY